MYDTLKEYFTAHREEIFSRLAALVAIPSVMGAPEEGMPYGRAVDDALRASAALFAEEGFPAERDPEGHYVLASYGEGERTIGIFAHADVVPAGLGWTLTEPFSPLRRDGALVGRGAEDNKSGIIAALYLLKAVRELAIPVNAKILVFIGGCEESGMHDIKAFNKKHKAPDVSLVPDNSFPFSLGEKGRITAWIASPYMLGEILDFHGGNAYNAVMDEVTVTLARSAALANTLGDAVANRPEMTLCVGEEEITLTVKGRSAHAAAPAKGINAAGLAATLLADCPALAPDDRIVMRSASLFLSDPYGAPLGIAGNDGPFGNRTAVIGMARVRDGRLYLSQDIRYGAALAWSDLEPAVLDNLEAEEWEMIPVSKQDGFDLGDDSPLSAALLDVYKRVTGRGDAKPYRSFGGTYARCLPMAYSIGTVLGGTRPDFIPEGHGGAHAPDEFISEDGYLAALPVMAEFLITVDEYLKNV